MEASSGNVFADLDLPHARELDTKVHLAVAINRLLAARQLTQAEAAAALSINQPKVSALKHYKLEGLSVERLIGLPYRVSSRQDNRVALVAGFRRIDQATQAGTHCSSVARIRALRLRASLISRPTVPLADKTRKRVRINEGVHS